MAVLVRVQINAMNFSGIIISLLSFSAMVLTFIKGTVGIAEFDAFSSTA